MTNDDLAEAAMCLWEACLENQDPHYNRYREDHGASDTRLRVLAFAKQCHEAWALSDFDGPFDWEWCPMFLRLCVDENFWLKFTTAAEAAAFIKENT